MVGTLIKHTGPCSEKKCPLKGGGFGMGFVKIDLDDPDSPSARACTHPTCPRRIKND